MPKVSLLRADGSPNAICYAKPVGTRMACILVRTPSTISRSDSTLGVTGNTFDAQYERAVDIRLGNLDLFDDAEARKTLMNAKEAFMRRYHLRLVPVTHYALVQDGPDAAPV